MIDLHGYHVHEAWRHFNTKIDNAYYAGDAIVTSIARSASFDGAVEYSISFDGTGDLTYNAAP